MNLLNFEEMDEVSERFRIDGALIVDWKDSRLAFQPQPGAPRLRHYTPDEVWHPNLQMVNATRPRESHGYAILAEPDGAMHYIEFFSATLSSALYLAPFPFDSERLQVYIQPFLGADENIAFGDPDRPSRVVNEPYTELASWRIMDFKVSRRSAAPAFGGFGLSPEMIFTLVIQRRPRFYVWKVFVPLMIIVLTSWTIFWISTADFYNQVTIAVTTLLSVIAFGFAISQSLPKLGYLTMIDAFFITCYVFVFGAIVEMTVAYSLRRQGRDGAAERLHRFSRGLFPLAFVIVSGAIALHFLAMRSG